MNATSFVNKVTSGVSYLASNPVSASSKIVSSAFLAADNLAERASGKPETYSESTIFSTNFSNIKDFNKLESILNILEQNPKWLKINSSTIKQSPLLKGQTNENAPEEVHIGEAAQNSLKFLQGLNQKLDELIQREPSRLDNIERTAVGFYNFIVPRRFEGLNKIERMKEWKAELATWIIEANTVKENADKSVALLKKNRPEYFTTDTKEALREEQARITKRDQAINDIKAFGPQFFSSLPDFTNKSNNNLSQQSLANLYILLAANGVSGLPDSPNKIKNYTDLVPAVRAFQELVGIRPDGFWGQNTFQAMKENRLNSLSDDVVALLPKPTNEEYRKDFIAKLKNGDEFRIKVGNRPSEAARVLNEAAGAGDSPILSAQAKNKLTALGIKPEPDGSFILTYSNSKQKVGSEPRKTLNKVG